MVYKFFDKKNKGRGVTTLTKKSAIKSIPQNKESADELHINPLLKKLKKEECIRHSKTIFGVPI